jgi:hypothetical protein
MATVKLRYYVVKNGNGFWQPAPHMRATGARPIACGPDGPAAWSVAKRAYEKWKSGIEAEAARMPKTIPGTTGAAFERYRNTIEWAETIPDAGGMGALLGPHRTVLRQGEAVRDHA